MNAAAPSSDSLRAVLRGVFHAPAYRWQSTADPLRVLEEWFARVAAWWHTLDAEHPWLATLAIGVMVGVLVIAIGHLIRTSVRAFRRGADTIPGSPPAAIVRDAAWYRGEADRLASRGLYRQAMTAEFVAVVLAFDAEQVVRYHPSKTPREYAREARLDVRAQAVFSGLVDTLYRCVFAHAPCTSEEFAAWRASAREEARAGAH